jgi:hypothetical protein
MPGKDNRKCKEPINDSKIFYLSVTNESKALARKGADNREDA